MGWSVGFDVGVLGVGVGDGLPVGLSVGLPVGLSVGLAVGLSVGFDVGVGFVVGGPIRSTQYAATCSAPPASATSAAKAALSSDDPLAEWSVAWNARQRPA